MSTFSDVLDRLIRESGTEAQEIARQVPCNAGHVSRLRTGRKRPSLQVAGRLDEVLGAGGELVAAAVGDGLPAEVRRLMAERGMSLRGLARATGDDPSLLSKYVNGKRPMPAHVAERLDDELGGGGELAALAPLRRRAPRGCGLPLRPSSSPRLSAS